MLNPQTAREIYHRISDNIAKVMQGQAGSTRKLLAALASPAMVHAQGAMGAMPAKPAASASAGVASGGSDQMHMAMMNGMDSMKSMPMTGDTDKDFASMMKVHHQQALDMAKIELAKGKSPEMKAMAHKIIAAQQKEIAEFDKWLASHK